MRQRLRTTTDRLAHLGEMLDSLSPLATLERGYAIVTDSSGRVVRDARQVASGDKVEARLARGRLGLTVNRTDAG
jgi:exodeoxyribonuclease VII large subunit